MTVPRSRRYTPPQPPPIRVTEFVCESCGQDAWFVHACFTRGECDCDARTGYRRTCDDCGPVQ